MTLRNSEVLIDDWHSYCTAIGWIPNPYQELLAIELLKMPKVANVSWARGTGKTAVLGKLALFLVIRLNWTVIIAAPVAGQTSEMMKEAKDAAFRLYKPKDLLYSSDARIEVRGKGRIVCISGSEQASVQGKHGQVLILDEKQDMLASVAAEDFVGMVAPFNGSIWMAGVGGGANSAGEVFGAQADYTSTLDYLTFITYRPSYRYAVDLARNTMFPEEFEAHYNCKPVDLSSHLLLPTLIPLDKYQGDGLTIVGIDIGKIDKTVATLTHRTNDQLVIDDWFVATGAYDKQAEGLAEWLNRSVEWDQIYAEKNGVGDVFIDFLRKRVPAVQAIQIDAGWKDEKARRLYSLSKDGKISYNQNAKLAGVFLKDVNSVQYKMTDNKHIKVDHSDFISSLLLTLQEPKIAYL